MNEHLERALRDNKLEPAQPTTLEVGSATYIFSGLTKEEHARIEIAKALAHKCNDCNNEKLLDINRRARALAKLLLEDE